jgi:quercetin dioxygenase-like cupin family protein
MTTSPIQRAADAPTYRLSDTDVVRFVFAGDASSPDVYEERLAPGEGPPLHSHPWATWDVVVEGSIRVRVAEETFEAGPGDGVYTPPDVPHTYMAVGDEPARIIGFNSHGGLHTLIAATERMLDETGSVDPVALTAVGEPLGARLHGPPLAVLEADGFPS